MTQRPNSLHTASDFVEVLVFRRSAGALSYLLLKRSPTENPYPGIWQVVSGRRGAGEGASETALREIHEETALEPIGLWVVPFVNTFYSDPERTIHMVPVFAAEVAPDALVTISDEHSEFRWVSREEAAGLVQWPAHLTMMDLVRDFVVQPRGSTHKVPMP